MDKLLFTPGPLTTSSTVKNAMMHDLGSRDNSFLKIVREIRDSLLTLGEVSVEKGYETILMQGSGTFGVESVISTAIPKNGKLLVLINGAYGERMARMAEVHKIPFESLRFEEDQIPNLELTENILAGGSFTHLAIVHCETTSGIINPIESFGTLTKKVGLVYIVDAMSSFGAVPLSIDSSSIDFLVSSSNKCIEGVPGFSFIIAKKGILLDCKGQADTLSLDLYHQWEGLERDGQFRFTPPVHALLAFHQALVELDQEGGVEGRSRRYRDNHQTLSAGMEQLGFREFLPPDRRGYIINSYYYPNSPAFSFNEFYKKLNEKGFVIYPGKLSKADCFRIGNIGRLNQNHIFNLLDAISQVKVEMGF